MKISVFQVITFSGLLISSGKCLSTVISDPPKVVYKLGKTEGSLTKLRDGKLYTMRNLITS